MIFFSKNLRKELKILSLEEDDNKNKTYIVPVVDKDFYEAQKRLIEKINSDSEITREILPMENSTKPVTVTIGLGIRQISTVVRILIKSLFT